MFPLSVRDECRSVVAECQRELEEQLARQRALLSVASERISSDLADDVVTRFIREIASEEHRFVFCLIIKGDCIINVFYNLAFVGVIHCTLCAEF